MAVRARSSGVLGLYLHIPFCAAICHYCNFNRGLLDEAVKARYLQALQRHVRREADGAAVDTIFFGGGTPSLLRPDEVASVLATCRASFDVSPGAEITLEANPETITPESLAGYRAAGITRLSFGVQSFRDDELQRLGRVHDAARARQALGDARRAGFDDISLDLMMWLPGQSVVQWLESVSALVDAAPDHASLYLLELYPNAPLQELMARQQWSRTADDDAADMYEEGLRLLEDAGWQQYEISNVSRPGRQCRHNLKYWQDGSWLAFGVGAHGRRHGQRFRHVASIDEYVTRVDAGADPVAERTCLSAEEGLAEALFMGLRLSQGVSLSRLSDVYGIDVLARYGPALEPAREAGLLVVDGDTMRLTRRGLLLSSEVMQVFV